MIRKLSILFMLPFIFSCGNDSLELVEPMNQIDDEGVVMEEGEPSGEESQTELFSYSVEVQGNYFNEIYKSSVFLSNEDGQILIEKELENNSVNLIELVVDKNSKHDLTFLIQNDSIFKTRTTIHTFTNVSSANLILNYNDLNGNGDSFKLSFFNSGWPEFDIKNLSPIGTLLTNENGGSYSQDFKLNSYPGDIYATFQSLNDTTQRYFYKTEIERNSEFEIDYTSLPFVENTVNIDFPFLGISGVSLFGFNTYNGKRYRKPLYHSGISKDLLFPDGIFDNYEISSFFNCCDSPLRKYSIKIFGFPEDQEIVDSPIFNVTLIDRNLKEFHLESSTEYDFSTIYYLKQYETTNFEYYIHSTQTNVLVTSKETLLDNILMGSEAKSIDFNFASVFFKRNSEIKSDYLLYLQSVIARRSEYPPGTVVEVFNIRD